MSDFREWLAYWEKRSQDGEHYVGRKGEDHLAQQQRIETALEMIFKPEQQYQKALDYGCGYGRFIPYLLARAETVYAADILKQRVEQACSISERVKGVVITEADGVPAEGYDLVFACLSFQHVVEDERLIVICRNIALSCRSGARVVLIDNAKDQAKHVKARTPLWFVEKLGLTVKRACRITIDVRQDDHWLIDGVIEK